MERRIYGWRAARRALREGISRLEAHGGIHQGDRSGGQLGLALAEFTADQTNFCLLFDVDSIT